MPPITVYTTQFCPYCMRAKRLLAGKGAAFTEIAVDHDEQRWQEMQERSGRRTVPQIWIGDLHVGGFDDLWRLDRQGRLDELLAATAP